MTANIDGITHKIFRNELNWVFGATWCGKEFSWLPEETYASVLFATKSNQEIDCMVCIAAEARYERNECSP